MVNKKLSQFSEEVASLIPKLVRGMFKRQTDVLGKGKITVPQYTCMDLLKSKGSAIMKEIASELNISLPAATGLVDRLFLTGFVKRAYDPSDRRIVKITLTEKGKHVVAEVKEKRKAAIKEVFSNLTETERQQYLKIVRKIMIILDKKAKKK